MTELKTITSELMKPFDLKDVDLLPKAPMARDGRDMCLALPYADIRVYQDRLNALCPGEWSTPLPTPLIVGNKLVMCVSVIVCGVVHSDVGEAPSSSDNAATEALAQGFKRACSQFGLGRYLYDLEKEYVPYDKAHKRISLNAEGKRKIVATMYQKAGIPVSAPPTPRSTEETTSKQTEDRTRSAPQKTTRSAAKNPSSEDALKTEFASLGIVHPNDNTPVSWAEFLKYKLRVTTERELTYDECKKADTELQPYRDKAMKHAS